MTRPNLLTMRLGAERAAQLAAILGGTRVRVPANLSHPANNAGTLRARVGEDLFVLLVLHFGDSTIYVPNGKPSRPVDPRKAKRLVNRGWSTPRIARELGCSHRWVERFRAKLARP